MSLPTNDAPKHCGKPMRFIKGKPGKTDFYGCSNYPRCKHTQAIIPEAKVIERLEGSAEQEVLWDQLVNGTTHLIWRARAGTGKTWSAVQGSIRLNPNGNYIFVAFNKKNAMELQQRLPNFVTACTVHSFGNGIVTKAYGFKRADQYKTRKILEDMPEIRDSLAMGVESAERIAYGVKELVSKVKNMLLETDDKSLGITAVEFGIHIDQGEEHRVFDLVRKVLDISKSVWGIRAYSIDYDDMIWLPIVNNLPVPQYDICFIDEAQDTNASRRILMLKSIGMGLTGRMVVIGDDRQSMYLWAGAGADSMDWMMNALQMTALGVKDLPLTINHRCGKCHIRMAQKLVPDIQYSENAPEGSIESVNNDFFVDNVKPGQMVICRKNAPLVKHAFRLLREGIPVVIQGRDFHEGLIRLINQLGRQDGKKRTSKKAEYCSIELFFERLFRYHEKERARILAHYKNPESALEHLQDKIETIEALCADKDSVLDVIDSVNTLFKVIDSAEPTVLTLSSVHRAKGMEAPVVWILHPEFMPMTWKKMTEAQYNEELNILYVAVTRVLARKDLEGSGRLFFVGEIPEVLH